MAVYSQASCQNQTTTTMNSNPAAAKGLLVPADTSPTSTARILLDTSNDDPVAFADYSSQDSYDARPPRPNYDPHKGQQQQQQQQQQQDEVQCYDWTTHHPQPNAAATNMNSGKHTITSRRHNNSMSHDESHEDDLTMNDLIQSAAEWKVWEEQQQAGHYNWKQHHQHQQPALSSSSTSRSSSSRERHESTRRNDRPRQSSSHNHSSSHHGSNNNNNNNNNSLNQSQHRKRKEEENVHRFCALASGDSAMATRVDPSVAVFFLELTDQNVEAAVQLYQEQQQADHASFSTMQGSFREDDQDEYGSSTPSSQRRSNSSARAPMSVSLQELPVPRSSMRSSHSNGSHPYGRLYAAKDDEEDDSENNRSFHSYNSANSLRSANSTNNQRSGITRMSNASSPAIVTGPRTGHGRVHRSVSCASTGSDANYARQHPPAYASRSIRPVRPTHATPRRHKSVDVAEGPIISAPTMARPRRCKSDFTGPKPPSSMNHESSSSSHYSHGRPAVGRVQRPPRAVAPPVAPRSSRASRIASNHRGMDDSSRSQNSTASLSSDPAAAQRHARVSRCSTTGRSGLGEYHVSRRAGMQDRNYENSSTRSMLDCSEASQVSAPTMGRRGTDSSSSGSRRLGVLDNSANSSTRSILDCSEASQVSTPTMGRSSSGEYISSSSRRLGMVLDHNGTNSSTRSILDCSEASQVSTPQQRSRDPLSLSRSATMDSQSLNQRRQRAGQRNSTTSYQPLPPSGRRMSMTNASEPGRMYC